MISIPLDQYTDEVFLQETLVTSPLNENLFIESLYSELKSVIFDELICKEKHGIKITVSFKLVPEI